MRQGARSTTPLEKMFKDEGLAVSGNALYHARVGEIYQKPKATDRVEGSINAFVLLEHEVVKISQFLILPAVIVIPYSPGILARWRPCHTSLPAVSSKMRSLRFLAEGDLRLLLDT